MSKTLTALDERDGLKIIYQVKLDPKKHRETGATFHSVNGNKVVGISALQIEQAEGMYYLFYLNDASDLLTDTLHFTVEAAMGQANFEFSVSPEEWEKLPDC